MIENSDMPMMMIRMKCPACRFEYRFLVEVETPLVDLPEITKQVMRCRCKNHIPKIDKNTPLENTLMSINAVPLRILRERMLARPAFRRDGNEKLII